MDHPWARAGAGVLPWAAASHPGHGPGAAEAQAGPQPLCHLCWKQFEGPELAEHCSDTAWQQLGIAERWHFRQGRG